LVHELVELGVGDRRRVLRVVAATVLGDLGGQDLMARTGFVKIGVFGAHRTYCGSRIRHFEGGEGLCGSSTAVHVLIPWSSPAQGNICADGDATRPHEEHVLSTRTSGAARPESPSRRAFRRRPSSAGEGRFVVPAMEGMAVRAAEASLGGRSRAAARGGGYGEPRELTRTDPVTGFEQTLWLPEGFDFQALSVAGSRMDDGDAVPLGHGGMACFTTGEPGAWH